MSVPDRLVPGSPRLISLFIRDAHCDEASGKITADLPEPVTGKDKK
jgi:hypothetical protein